MLLALPYRSFFLHLFKIAERNIMTKQSATYQQLQSALAQTGCPICQLGQQTGHSYLDGILWESVNDPSTRAKLTSSLGFCGRHTRETLTFAGEKLGVAIIQRAVLQEVARRLQTLAIPQRTFFQRIQDQWRNQPDATSTASPLNATSPCPACVQQAAGEKRALQVLLEHLQQDLDEPLRKAGGLCLPHLQDALQECRQPEVAAALIELQQAAWQDLGAHLSEFIRKNDHRFQGEKITEGERAAVDRAVAALTGEYPIR